MTEQERLEEAEVFDKAIDGGEETALVVTAEGPSRLLEIAVRQDLDIDKLERIMAMQERWNEQKAKEAYYNALSQFQQIVPTLEKRNVVDFVSKKTGARTHYAYASLADIKGQIQEGLSNCGFSYRWEFADKADQLEVTCILTHLSGHSEKTTMTAPADTSGSKNPVQERASTITYLQRYTLIGALGLATANMDDDGRKGAVASPPPEEAAKDLPPVPEGTDTKTPKPEVAGKTDFEKQQQLLDYLKEICGTHDVKVLTAELVELTKFDEKPEGEPSLRKLTGQWLNTAIGKAKGKLGHATAKEELLQLLKTPILLKVLDRKRIDEFIKDAEDKRHKEQWFLDQLPAIKGFIADAERKVLDA